MSSSRAAAMRWGNGCGVGGDDDGKTQIRNWCALFAQIAAGGRILCSVTKGEKTDDHIKTVPS